MGGGKTVLPEICAALLIVVLFSQMVTAQSNGRIRPAYCAGSWYPAERDDLQQQLDGLMEQAAHPTLDSKPIAVIGPHAGYRFSAAVAAGGYATLRGQRYNRVIVLAFSHRNSGRYPGVDVPGELMAYQTPLGQVSVDREVCDALLKEPIFSSHPGMDQGEHSLELQIPFLQRAIGEFKLVPLLVCRMSDADNAAAARALLPYVDDDTLLVASSDFTHYGENFGYLPFRENVSDGLQKLAADAAAPILVCDYDGFQHHLNDTHDTICGRGPVSLLLRILSMRGGAEGSRAAFDTSGHLTGDWQNSVTYQSFVFTQRKPRLSRAERATLLALARTTIAAHLNRNPLPEIAAETLTDNLRKDGACFVTLKNQGQLRGCIGNMTSIGPLYQAVLRNAVSACQDYRFAGNAVTAAEEPQLDIEISCLTPLKTVANISNIVVGRHGLLITMGPNRGVLLPQVAYERGWTREEFLEHTCRKAGLPINAWQHKNAVIESFEAEVFGEGDGK